MTQQLPRLATQRAVWDKILNRIREELIVPALQDANIARDLVGETRLRWDALDITMSWPKDNPGQNVHAWLTGDWPTYQLNFEGAAWQDDWEKLRRRGSFFKGLSGIVELSPTWNDPTVEIRPLNELRENVVSLAHQVTTADLSSLEWEQALQPNPSR